MNANLRSNTCDADRLESFLSGALSDAQEREIMLHLNACEECRRALERRAAEPEAWREAEELLRPYPFEAQSAGEDADELPGNTRQPPLQIQNVLDALGPTDDPQMLGRLGGYEVSGVVGAGGMGVVLKAIDQSLDRTVAIKVLAPYLASSGAARKRFAREAKAAAAVLHPNVIAIHSVSKDEALPYLVMPYVRGTSLQKRLDREGPLPLQEILRIGAQIAAGLAAAHAQGLVHRDITPANILLEEGVERVTITDFGLARAVDDATITHSGMIAGTPQYMSPEQARGEAVDLRSDLFSLGSVLYALCTGRPPFRAETSYGVMRRITDDESTAIRDINPDTPEWLCQIINKLMSKRAADRYQSAAEVADLLEECLAHVQQPTLAGLPPSLRPAAKASRLCSISRRWGGVIATIAAFGLGLLGVFAWQATEPPDIAGNWSGPDWGEVVLTATQPGVYNGTYTDTFKERPGAIQVTWSRLEGRYKGTWREGQDRSGKISLRLVDNEIRGAWTTSRKSAIHPGTPELADLTWKRSSEHGARPGSSRPQGTATGPGQPRADGVASQLPSGDANARELQLSEAKEIVLSMDGLKFMLDLDTGATMDPPATIRPEQGQMDIHPNQVQPYHYPTALIGQGLSGLEVKESDWDTSAADVRRALSGKGVGPLKEMDLGPERHPTYFFKTRDGARGVLQLLGLVDDPKGIRLRYKTIKEKPAAEQRGDVLTPKQIVESGDKLYHSRQRIAVQFQVLSAAQITVKDEKGVDHEMYDLYADEEPKFSVRVTDTTITALKSRGVMDVDGCFAGKWIRVEGTVYGVGLDLISRPDTLWTYHIDLNSLDQLSFVDPPAESRSTPGQLQGTVIDSLDQEFVEISLGAHDGLRQGDTLSVSRDKTYLGKITVRRAASDHSIARIDARKGDIRRGDLVTNERTSDPVAPEKLRAEFLRHAGDSAAAGKLYDRIAADEHLVAVLTEATQFPERRGILYAAELWRVWREAASLQAKEGGVPATDAAVCFYLGCDPASADSLNVYPAPSDATEGFRTHETLLLSMAVRMELFAEERKEPFGRLIAGWAAVRADPWTLGLAIETAREYRLEAMVPVVRQMATDSKIEARFRAPAITLLAELGGQAERPLLQQLLDHGSECHRRKLTIKGEDAPTAIAQIRDVALGCLLLLDGADMQAAGFDELNYLYREPLKPHEYFRGAPFGFFTAEQRNATHAKFAALALSQHRPPKRLRQFSVNHRVGAVACSPDGKLIAITNIDVTFPLTADWKPVVEILDAQDGRTVVLLQLATDDEHKAITGTEGLPDFEVGPLAFSPDGATLAVSTGLGQVRLFDARNGELIRSLDDENARLADQATPEKLQALPRAMGRIRSLAFSPDGGLLATCGESFSDVARHWNRIERGGLGERSSTGPGRLKVWDVKSGALKHDLAGHSHVFGVAFSPDGSWLASAGRWSTASNDGNGVLLWDLENGTIHRTILIEANGATHSVVFSPLKKLAAIGSRIFDKENDTSSTAIGAAYPLSGITQWQQTIPGSAAPKAFLPDGKSVVVQCDRQSIRFIDAEAGQYRHEIKAAESAEGGHWIDLALAPKADILVIVGADHGSRAIVEIWRVPGFDTDTVPLKDADDQDSK